ncbi:uncharacterized protein LOC127726766 [Mytilus californianus]|uniref:uncharacterized protein LOC127726766 n=1 Tax=Mytilus californianus TaxID=6549 RepID=UPI0022459873|nr:uncharacterized protein LOC127726766 [Mytilus californianus]
MQGLTICTTAVFIIGEIAGVGVLALPRAVDDTGWIGFVLIVVFTLLSTYTATLIGKCWAMIQERYPEYRSHVPDPYPIMGEKTYGKTGRYLVTITLNIFNFGSSVVFLVLAAGNIETLLTDVIKDISFCYWLMILTCIVVPIVCLGTPKDFCFRPIGVGAAISTGIACTLIIIQIFQDNSHSKNTTVHSNIKLQNFSSAFGTMVFAVSGHSVFPTIITDMKKKEDFKLAALLGYGIVLLMYIPTAASGYFVYGRDVNVNIIRSIPAGPLAYVVDILVTLHLLLGFIIYMNPVCQQFEAKVGVPKAFTWKRCIVRPLIVLVVLFIAESVPHFGAILSLVGGSTTTLLSYVFPCLFYMKLCNSNCGNKTDHPSSVIEWSLVLRMTSHVTIQTK